MDRDQIGHKLMLAFRGLTPPAYIKEWLAREPVGGFSLFREFNVESAEQFRALTDALQQMAKAAGQPPLVIAADQEGGQLIALGDHTSQFPGSMALGASHDPDLIRQVGYATGLEMAALGVNVNYAPVCDINTNPNNPSLGIRAFSDDPDLAASMAAAFVSGLQETGVAATIKHFPGKGAATVDSHYAMPLINHSRERLEAMELKPFQAAINAGAGLVMTGHFAIPVLTGTGDVPATLSRAVMHNFLRNEMGFKGLVITDALDMGAITQGVGQIIDVIAAVRAEVDLMLLMSEREVQERLSAGLKLAYSRGLVDDTHLRPSLARILTFKERIRTIDQPSLEVVGSAEHRALAYQAAGCAITLIRDEQRLLPLRPGADTRMLVVMPEPHNLTPADTSVLVLPTLAEALRFYHPQVDEALISPRPSGDEITGLREKAAGYDLLILGTISASIQTEQGVLVRELLRLGKPTITVALRTPYDLVTYPEASTYLCTYSILEPSMKALGAVLFGETNFAGKLPVTIEGLYPLGHGLSVS